MITKEFKEKRMLEIVKQTLEKTDSVTTNNLLISELINIIVNELTCKNVDDMEKHTEGSYSFLVDLGNGHILK